MPRFDCERIELIDNPSRISAFTDTPKVQYSVTILANFASPAEAYRGRRAMPLDDSVFLQEPSDLVQVLGYCDLAVIPEPSLGIYFVRPIELRDRAGYTIGVSGNAVRRACDGGLIAPTSHQSGQATEIVYVLTVEGRRHVTMNGHASDGTRAVVPLLRNISMHDLEHRLVAAEACFRRGQACIDRQQLFIESQARSGLCTTRAQTLANTFGEIQSTFAKTFQALSQRVL